MKTNKPGKLSKQELEYIRENIDKPIDELAKALKRNPDTIKKHLQNTQIAIFQSENSDELSMIARLIGRADWPSITRQFNTEEIEYFKEEWVKTLRQFSNDVSSTEELQIISMIRLRILTNRNLEERNQSLQEIARIQSELSELQQELRDATDDQEKMILSQQIQANSLLLNEARASANSRTNEYEKFVEKDRQILKDMKATREQIKKGIQDLKTSFVDWLKELQDKDRAEEEAKELALRKLALQKEKTRLSEFHVFQDGLIDQPLLTPETVKDD